MRYGIPAYRLPRDVMGAEVDRIAALGVRFTSNHRVEDLEAERREGAFDAVFVAVGAHLSKRVDIPAADAGHIVDARVVPARRGRGRAAGDRTSRGGLRRRQHGDGCRASRPADGRRGGADRLPAHPRADAGPRGGGGGRRAGGGADQLAADDQGDGGLRAAGRGDGARRDRLSAADRPVRDAGGRHGDPGPGPGERHRLPARRPGRGVRPRRDRTRVELADDRMPGRVRRRRHGALRAHRDRRRRARQAGRAGDRRVAARLAIRAPAQASAGGLRAPEPVVLRRSSSPPAAGARARKSDSAASTRWSAVSHAERGGVRGAPVPVVRQLHRVRRLPRRLPRGRGDQARSGAALPVRLRPLHRVPGVLRAVPGALDRDGAGGGARIPRYAFVAPADPAEGPR